MRLNGKGAIVTGAGRGIGQATATLFAEEGARVLVVDWNRETGAATAEAIQAAGHEARFCYADVSRAPDVEAMVRAAVTEFGRLDVLVNNAAIQIMRRLVETTEDEWDRLQSVNLKGVFLGLKYAIPEMIRGGGGSIVNIASVLGLVGDPDLAAYCAAKGGVISLTKQLAVDYGREGIRVNCICPGAVIVERTERLYGDNPKMEQLALLQSLTRIGRPQDIAWIAVYLASDEAAYVTGEIFTIDGGMYARGRLRLPDMPTV